MLRRTTFLEEVVETLALPNVEVVRGRADDLHGQRTFDVVTSRAVAPLERLLQWSMPLVAPEGALVAMKGSNVDEEIETARPVLTRWRCAEPEVLALGEGVLVHSTHALRVAWADPARVGWPLAPAKRSLAPPAYALIVRRCGPVRGSALLHDVRPECVPPERVRPETCFARV